MKVISFDEAKNGEVGIQAEIKKKQYSYCRHDRLWLDEGRRMVQCKDCKVHLEPFDWLVMKVRKRQYVWSSLEQARDELARIEARVAELKREERNTKARLARGKPTRPLVR